MKNESHSQNPRALSGPVSGVDNKSESAATTSLLAELLFYHAALGRGYNSPFPRTRGLVFTSALPKPAVDAFNAAENRFRSWHADEMRELHEEFERMSVMPKSVLKSPEIKDRHIMLKKELSKHPMVTYQYPDAKKADLFHLLARSYFGASTFFDPNGYRPGMALGRGLSRLESELSLYLLTDGGINESMIRPRGAPKVTFPADNPPVLYYFSCAASDDVIHMLQESIKESLSEFFRIGHCVLIPGPGIAMSTVTEEVLHDLMMKVFVKGKLEPDKRVQVMFDMDSEAEWKKFLNWGVRELIEEEGELSVPQQKLAEVSPASPELSVLFGARAAMVNAFLTEATCAANGDPIDTVFLTGSDLEWAKKFAKLIYLKSSGYGQPKRRKPKVTRGRAASVRGRRSKKSR